MKRLYDTIIFKQNFTYIYINQSKIQKKNIEQTIIQLKKKNK
jgi:hypothetical protein